MSEEPDVTAKDALQVAQRALARLTEAEERLDELEAENKRLTYRVAELEAEIPDESTPYERLSTDEKVGRLRRYLLKRADASSAGWYKLEYSDVKMDVFGGRPSADHCYKLMHLAAQADGFDYVDPPNGTKYLSADADAAKAGGAFSHAKKANSEGGR